MDHDLQDDLKWEFLKTVPIRDATSTELRGHEQLRGIAVRLREVASRSRWPQWAFANLALCLARDCISYQLDSDRVGREQIDGWGVDPYVTPLAPYERGTDDCDAKARFFVALCLAGNIQAEMVARWKSGKLAHVYARAILLGPGDKSARWYYAETILRRARLGDVAEDVPKEIETGKWLF